MSTKTPGRKVTVLPTVEPTPPPSPRTTEPKPVYRCNSGKKCPAYAEFGHAEKIRTSKGEKGYCDRCLSRRGDRTTRDLDARRAGGAPRTNVT
ncbi:MAG: hypothetical protein AVDCRST_MAG01-01-683 [uncultured Rubrobacteraceae bacterium]|uniref:Uncharacterized protein n=1 Tax=uncultured Rubrobacteraceae bacterium TaxID=349277 RepID=A0A6J4NUV4_9ACTN|nr:MAG: hypothetical protein AVDCRST_MAG01-01-683 [uncultured Rubrobacteraceae bacterium]